MKFILFINVKKCWHLNSIFKIGEFLLVNLNGDVSVMIHFCAGKVLVQENIASVDDYVHLVHNFNRRMTFAWHLKESFICQN